MATATAIKTGPVALSVTLTTNIHNPASTVVDYWRWLHVANKTTGSATFSMWLGATGANAAGTELFTGKSVAANDIYSYGWGGQGLKVKNADFIVGGASLATTLTALLIFDSTILA